MNTLIPVALEFLWTKTLQGNTQFYCVKSVSLENSETVKELIIVINVEGTTQLTQMNSVKPIPSI